MKIVIQVAGLKMGQGLKERTKKQAEETTKSKSRGRDVGASGVSRRSGSKSSGSDVVHVERVVEGDQVEVGVDAPERESHALGRGLLVVAVAC